MTTEDNVKVQVRLIGFSEQITSDLSETCVGKTRFARISETESESINLSICSYENHPPLAQWEHNVIQYFVTNSMQALLQCCPVTEKHNQSGWRNSRWNWNAPSKPPKPWSVNTMPRAHVWRWSTILVGHVQGRTIRRIT